MGRRFQLLLRTSNALQEIHTGCGRLAATVSNRRSSMELVCPLSATQPITLNFLYGDCISDAFTSIPGGKAGCVGVTENLFHSICGNPFLPYTAETPQMPFQQSILFYDSPVPS